MVEVALPSGTVAIPLELEMPASSPAAVVALAHGSGSGREHPFLVGLAAALREAGYATARFDFPYRAAGRRMPGPAAHAIATWSAVTAELARTLPAVPFVAAGKSYGGRMASMAAADGVIDPAALVYLGYPFHPPGKPEAPRGAHLPAIAAPQLFVEGTTDPFIQPLDQFTDAVATCQDAEIVWIAGGGHSFEMKGARRPADEVGALIAASVLQFLRTRVAPPARG
ncbi:MAG: dienelactone hydrolase [Microbacterium sp. SCN 70-200]|uniref:alpha/beta hydrolase family protein n=1 Tax=unclassified Microbacterium TaxID=2609290 RepID=UPI00086E6AD6|nr:MULTISPECIES: alpha/beta family hydrolase [unclassified Microbacterium]MBN9213244.1 dienelactone hydrolase family protein [Microbacterium sp.]ODT40688.1 MAG: dienelactone hydrolase [Microbacterium sp. SCN 70-200]OJV83685.1 MAG: dienelactone hydrolase [Microbacterium sp. 70-16]